jgi:aldehyde dehydrogenase (NAD+)
MNPFQARFDHQKTLFQGGRTRTREWRIDQLNRLELLLTENHHALTQALATDFKTSPFEQALEHGGSVGAVREAKAHLDSWMSPQPVELPAAFEQTGHRAAIYRDPYGVALLITPFNAPLVLLVEPLVAVLSAGNTAVVKPSENTSSSAALFEQLFEDYFDPAAVTVVRGNRQEIEALLALPFDFIFFTGSTAVGKVVMRAAAEHLTPVVLELGGQNPVIVDETANIDDAAAKLVWASMAFGGQWCVSPGYVYVHESIAKDFVAATRSAVERFYGAEPKSNLDVSRIISTQATQRLAGLIDPDKVVVGGEVDVAARYVAPTVLYPVDWSDAVMQEEIFGPILPVLPYRDLAEVVDVIQRKPRGLACYIFSRKSEQVDYLLSAIQFGSGSVNQAIVQMMFSALPFGGVGNSGIGHYHGKNGFDALTHAKSILFSESDVSIDDLLPPYADRQAESFLQSLAP